jgi:alkylhydroperoxidase family enzyme
VKHGRLEWFAPGDLRPDQAALYDAILAGPRGARPAAVPLTDEAGRFHGPFNAMLVDPVVGHALQSLGAALRFASPIADRAREIAILEVAVARRSDFEWWAHVGVARSLEMSEDEIACLAAGEPCASFSAEEEVVREVTRALLAERDLPGALWERAVAALGEVVLVDLVALVGFYDCTALALSVFRVPLPDGLTPVFGAPAPPR